MVGLVGILKVMKARPPSVNTTALFKQ
jgi:hypothetical protein